MSPRRQVPPPPPNWRRLTIATFSIFFGLAAFVLVVCELVMPAVSSASTPSSSAFNYGAMFGANFFRPFGRIVAAALVIMAPISLLLRGADVLGDRLKEWVRGDKS
jgi:hypothetical protein